MADKPVQDEDALWQALRTAQLNLRSAIEAWMAESGKPLYPWAPALKADQLKNCQFVPTRYHLLDLLPKNATCIEVGTQAGNFAREIITRAAPYRFHILDLNLNQFARAKFEGEIGSGQVLLHEGDSSTILASFPDKYFDWIYVDGDHGYEGIKKDLAQAKTKVKDGGLIICNDYTFWSPAEVHAYGVPRAVNELCAEDGWEFVYFAFQGQGYHDIGLRKMPA